MYINKKTLIWILFCAIILIYFTYISWVKEKSEEIILENTWVTDVINCKNWNIINGIKWYCNSEGQSQYIPYLEGSDRLERMRELLRDYDKEYLYESFFWWGKNNWILPELAICIAKADTNLWKQLKSQNNLWNVGNNDRGNTITYDSEYRAIEWIYRVLNNQYLWNYTQLGQLSRKHNKDWKIYASSPENWFNNVANCIGSIRWEQIDEYFNFRF
jgi:hypothetical protein